MSVTDGSTANMARAVWRSFRALLSQRGTAVRLFSSMAEESGLRDFPGQGVGSRPQIVHFGGRARGHHVAGIPIAETGAAEDPTCRIPGKMVG